MTSLSKTIAVLVLGAAALPTATFAQGLMAPVAGGTLSSFIADLEGNTRAVSDVQARAYGLDALPAGESYGVKDSRIVVLDDATGGVVSIVRVIADLSSTTSTSS